MSWPVDCTVAACVGPWRLPVGMFTLPCCMAFTTSSSPMPRVASSRGSSCARTAYFCEPRMFTCATPGVVEMRCARSVSAYSFTSESRSVEEVSAR